MNARDAKTIVITGAAGGIGVETIKRLAAPDINLFLIDYDASALQALTQLLGSLPGHHQLFHSALADLGECDGALDEATGKIAGLVHLAGVFEKDDDGTPKEAVYERAIANNLTNGYNMADAVNRRLDPNDSAAFVFISSLAFRRGSWAHVPYAAAKGGLVGMTRALARRLAPRVRVNALAPGLIDTAMPMQIIAERGAQLTAEIPLGRLGHPAEVASVIRFLMSEDASYITGQVINVDGGVVNS